jgi:AcrR family transcriptional regulator
MWLVSDRIGRRLRGMPPSLRPSRDQLDREIVDRAAALFARHGFAHTSLQAVADATGYSKAGLLHHFPSKQALHDAALARCRAQAEAVLDLVAPLPVGPERDLRAIAALADAALSSPGLTALNLGTVSTLAYGSPADHGPHDGAVLFATFGVDPADGDPDRLIRVISALAALSVVAVVAHQVVSDPTAWRRSIIAASFDALGHRRPGATTAPLDQVEA